MSIKHLLKPLSAICATIMLMAMPLNASSEIVAETSDDNISLTQFSQSIVQEYSAQYPEYSSDFEEAVVLLIRDPHFISAYEGDRDNAIRNIYFTLDCIAHSGNASTLAYNPSSAHFYSKSTVPVINQVYSYTCGPASYLQALIGNGILANNSDNTSASAVLDAADEIGTTPRYGSNPQQVTDALNRQEELESYYSYNFFTEYTYNQSIYMLQYAFMNDITPIVYVADTSYFNYYNGASYKHFVTVSSVNYQSQRIVIVDPNYVDAYRGTHTITFNEFYNAMRNTSSDGEVNSYIIGSTSVD